MDRIKLEVVNHQLQVGSIRIMGVAGSSVILIGDTETIDTSAIFDTPPESLIIGPLVPIAPGG